MSVRAIAWAWKQDIGPTEMYVLVALADYANQHDLAWPSLDSLATKTKLHRTTVIRALNKLQQLAIVRRERRKETTGRDAASYYHLARVAERDSRVAQSDSVSSGAPPMGSGELLLEDPIIDPSLNHKRPSVSSSQDNEKLTPEDLVEGWNDICGKAGLPRVREMPKERRSKTLLRIREHPDGDWWGEAMGKIARSDFCCGRGPSKNGATPWRADFDWLVKNDTNAVKAFEGRYR